MYAIQKNLPIPQAHTKITRGRKAKYPFRAMKAGDSFAVPATASTRAAVQRRVAVAAIYAAKRLGAKFTTRCLATAVRVWRVA